MKFETPDWDYWLHLPTVTACEALLLSFDICPDDYERRLGEFDVSEAFDRSHEKRRRLLFAHLENPESFNFQKKRLRHTEIHLAEFARWATQDMGWKDLPPQMIELASVDKQVNSVNPESTLSGDQSQQGEITSNDWHEAARKIATELWLKAKNNGYSYTLEELSAKVMDAMRERGIMAPQGFIDNPHTVRRDALGGKHWWQNKHKLVAGDNGKGGKNGK